MKLWITGIGGLIGSSVAELAHSRGWEVAGVDADYRGRWFGKEGSVEWRLAELSNLGIRIIRDDFRNVTWQVARADAIVHCASQPSHDYSRSHVLEDSAINYMGTVELLEATRQKAPNASFIFLSTNKVYGDRVNTWNYTIEGNRFVCDPDIWHSDGVDENLSIDGSLHTPFGVSKAAADLMVQEYRHCFGLKTVSLRCGCLTGKSGSAVELQGFLGYLVKCAVEGKPYTIYGHGGYQVRDNIDAEDLAEAILLCAENPKDAVYNMGGGPENTISVLEAINYLKSKGFEFEVRHGPARVGDHKCWVSDISKFQRDYPGWKPKKSVYEVLDEMAISAVRRRDAEKGHSTLPSGAHGEARVQ